VYAYIFQECVVDFIDGQGGKQWDAMEHLKKIGWKK
jgi:hypothetical protein